MSVIFQDFVRYDFMLRENIAVGNIARLGDEPTIKTAAERSLADSVAQRLKGRYDQMLGKPPRVGWISRVASGRRWRWRGRTCHA